MKKLLDMNLEIYYQKNTLRVSGDLSCGDAVFWQTLTRENVVPHLCLQGNHSFPPYLHETAKLRHVLLTNPTLQHLSIEDYKLMYGDELVPVFKKSALTGLSLIDCSMASNVLVSWLTNMSSLTVLQLMGIHLSPSMARVLAAAVKRTTVLKTLQLRCPLRHTQSYKETYAACVTVIIHGLLRNGSVHHFGLQTEYCTTALGRALALLVLRTAYPLVQLALKITRFTTQGLYDIFEALGHTTHLHTLGFNAAHVGTHGEKYLTAMLHHNTTLRALQLNDVDFGYARRELRPPLLAAIGHHPQLIHVSLHGYKWDTTSTACVQAFRQSYTLQEVLADHRFVNELSLLLARNKHIYQHQRWSPRQHTTFSPAANVWLWVVLLCAQRYPVWLSYDMWVYEIFPHSVRRHFD